METADLWEPVRHATGHCLVTGLGLGIVVNAMLLKPGVERVTVLEIDPDIIGLVGSHYRAKFGDRLELIEADALTWKPPRGARYAAVWHDIWPAICADYLPEIRTLKVRYARRCDWQGVWAEDEMRRG